MAWTTSDRSSGFAASVAVTNTGTSALNPGTLRWAFGAGQTVTQSCAVA